MLRLIPAFLWFALVITSSGCSGRASEIDFGRVLTSGRDGWQYPERVIESLDIQPGDHVAEIGAGSGYWVGWLSEAVGPDGRVYAVEVDADLVTKLEERVAQEGFRNVEVLLGAYDDPRLPNGRIDLALTSLTYHHIEDRVVYFEKLQQDLTARGRVAHLDDRPDSPAPISWFQTDGHWSVPSDVTAEMMQAGYLRQAAFDFLPVQSLQVYVPVDSKTGANADDDAAAQESVSGMSGSES